MGEILRPRSDWMPVLDAIYAPDADDQRWVEGIRRAAAGVFDPAFEVGVGVLVHGETCADAHFVAMADEARKLRTISDVGGLAALGVHGVRHYFYPPGLVATQRELESSLPDLGPKEVMQDARARVGAGDAVGVLAHPAPGRVVLTYALAPEPILASRQERAKLARLALHLDAAARLRASPSEVRAVLDERGNVLSAARSGLDLAPIGRRIDAFAGSGEVLALWPALLEGELTLVRRHEGGRVLYHAIANPPAQQGLRALSAGEAAALREASRGLPTKLVAYALGVTPAVVSGRLASAAAKLGLASVRELLRIAGMLVRDPRAAFPTVDLTAAEREIVALLQRGLSNREIAARRERSVRTIANQVASILEKTGSPSRRAVLVSGAASLPADLAPPPADA